MNSCIKSIGAARDRGWFNLRSLAVAWGALSISGAVCSAAFTENFQDDIVGLPPTPFWTISGANGTTATGNVASEGANQFLALRDFSSSTDLFATRDDEPRIPVVKEKAGYLQFDIRFNQGIDSYLLVKLNGSSDTGCCGLSTLEPIQLEFFHSAFNTNTPLIFRSKGNAEYTPLSFNFPIGSWETIRIDFTSAASGPPRGTYTVNWDGVTITNSYLDQGPFSSNLAIDSLLFIPAASPTTQSVDIDNILFIPEPSALAMVVVSSAALVWARRRYGKPGAQ